MEQANAENGKISQPETLETNDLPKNASSFDELKKQVDNLGNGMRKWYAGERKPSWEKNLEDMVQKLLERVEALEASRETQTKEEQRLTEERRTLNNDVAALRQDVAALSPLRPTADALTVERKRIEEKYRAEINRLREENERLEAEKKAFTVKAEEEIAELKKERGQLESDLEKMRQEKIENESKKNADPNKVTQGGAFAVGDAISRCLEAQNEILGTLTELWLDDVAGDATRFGQAAADYIYELFDATFNDCWDDDRASTLKSLAERLGIDGKTANKIKKQEEKIKENIAKLKEICARWLRENPNAEACRLYRPKPGESLKERKIWKSCNALGPKRLNEIAAPSGGCVGLTLIPGVYSQTKGSRANLAPAYVVVAQPNEPTEVEKTQGKENASQESELESTDFDLQLD